MKNLLTICAAAAAFTAATNTAFAEDPYVSTAGNHGNEGESHFIDTLYKVTPQTRFELDYALLENWESSWGSSFLFGGSSETPWFTAFVQSGYIGFHNGGGWKSIYVTGANTKNVRFTAILDNYENVARVVSGGVTNSLATTSASSFASGTIKIASHVEGAKNFAAIKIYGYRIFEAGQKVHDYTPVRKGGAIGFRDSVTGAFLSDDNTAALTASANIPEEPADGYVATPSGNSAIYIDTEYKATSNTCFMLDCALVDDFSGSSSWYLFYGYGSNPFSGYINPSSGFGTQVNSPTWEAGIISVGQMKKDVRRTFVLDAYNCRSYSMRGGVTENSVAIPVSTEHVAAAISVKIAASFRGDGNYVPMKVYGCKIYEKGVQVRNFVPRIMDGVAGLYDTITGLFVSYPSDKTRMTVNSLSVGGNIKVDPYIEGSGANGPYIVTDYKPCGATRAEIDFMQTAVDTVDSHYPFSIHAGTSNFKFGIFALAKSQTYGYNCTSGKANWTYGGMFAVTNVRTTLILDAKNKKYHRVEFGRTNATFTIDQTYMATDRSQYYLPIFSTHQDNASDTYQAACRMPMKLYSLKLYEDDVLVRDYVPAVSNGVAGLQDQLPGGKFLAPATGSFTCGGMFPVEVSQSATKVASGNTVTLTASAPGATSYRWLKNGEPIEGGTSGTLTVNWRKPKNTPIDTYQAVAVYTIDTATGESEPSAEMTVENLPAGMCVIFK